jgi:hypothetical protein
MSSKRRLRAKSCEGKVRHSTMAGAWIAARKTDEKVRPYKCRWCGSYHVGHPTAQAKRVRRQNGHG